MASIDFSEAYFINLGKSNLWAESSIREGKIRFGWKNIPLSVILERNWELIKHYESEDYSDGALTRDLEALRRLMDSGEEDIWATRCPFQSKPSEQFLWWCRMENGNMSEDELSRYRTTKTQWSNKNARGEVLRVYGSHRDKTLNINGKAFEVAKTTAFSGALCRVKAQETLKQLLNGEI